MKHNIKRPHLVLIFVSAILLLSLTGCDPGVWFRVENQTDQTLGFFLDEGKEVNIPPGELLEFSTISINPVNVYPAGTKFLIEAKTEQGEVVYSENFTWQELDDMDWTIVIPPLVD